MIRGDQVMDVSQFIYVPEEWQRAERNHDVLANLLKMLCMLLGLAFFIIGMLLQKQRIKPFSFIIVSASFFILTIINIFNLLPQTLASFNTVEPYLNQLFITFGLSMIISLGLSIFIGYFLSNASGAINSHHYQKRSSLTLIAGSCVCMGAALFTIIKNYLPSFMPYWKTYGYRGYSLPLLGFTLTIILRFMLYTGALLFISNALFNLSVRYKRIALFLPIICIVGCIALLGIMLPIDSIPQWLLCGSMLGIGLYAMQELFLANDVAIIPYVAGAALLGQILQQRGITGYSEISLLVLFALVSYTAQWLYKR